MMLVQLSEDEYYEDAGPWMDRKSRTNQGGRKDGRGNEPLPLKNVRCAEPPEDSLTLQCPLLQFDILCFACSWMKKWMNLVRFRRSWN